MKIISWIAAAAAAALLAVTWSATVQLSDYASSDWQDNPPPPAWRPRPSLPPAVNELHPQHDEMAETRAPRTSGRTLLFGTYQKCRRYIDQNFQRFATAQQIARVFHLNAADLDRMFRHYGHVHLDQYLSRLQRNQAAQVHQQENALAMAKQNSTAP
jgi:hypothetical protein